MTPDCTMCACRGNCSKHLAHPMLRIEGTNGWYCQTHDFGMGYW